MPSPDQRGLIAILKASASDFDKNECGTRAAALAYYTVFALPSLLILLVTVAGRVWNPDDVQRSLEYQFSSMVGEAGAKQIHEMMTHGLNTPGRGALATVVSVAGLLLGATGAFLSMQDALNRVWEVKPDPKQEGVRNFITKRLLSLGMVLGLGFLLAVSLAITAAITAVGGSLASNLPEPILYVADLVVSTSVLSALFSALFRILPDAKVQWRDVWVGGLATAVLFVAGKYVIGLYLGQSKPGDAFGAAGALAVVLVWAYYAGMIVLFGAEFTQEWATHRGRGARPVEGAVGVVEKEVVTT